MNYFYDLPVELQEYILRINRLDKIKNIYIPWRFEKLPMGGYNIQEKRMLTTKNKHYTYFSYYYNSNDDIYFGRSFLLYYTRNYSRTYIFGEENKPPGEMNEIITHPF